MTVPAKIALTIRAALRARASLAQAFADLPQAQQHIADVEMALEWLSQQPVEHEPVELHAPSEYDGPVVHEGLRWPPFGTHAKEYDGRRR